MKKILKCFPVLALLLSMAACGGSDAQSPANYSFDTGDNLPSLSAAVSLPDGVVFSEEADSETDAITYRYEELTDAGSYVSDYVGVLKDMYTCSVIDSDGVSQTQQPTFGEAGEVLVGADAPGGEGILQLRIVWDESSCSITPSLLEGQQIGTPEPSESLTLDEVTQFFQSLSPSQLGLSGTSMSEYTVFPKEGLAMVDDIPCVSVNVYSEPSNEFAGTYLLSLDGSRLYHVNNHTNQVTELSLGVS